MKAAALWFAAAVAAAPLPETHGEDWPQWRGVHRDSHSSERVSTLWPAEGPHVVWSASVGTGFSGVSVSQGRAYTMGNSTNVDSVWSFDARNGRMLWKYSYPAELSPQWYEGGPGATPTVDGRRVFTISKWGDVFCFDAVSGSIIWQRDLREAGIKPNRWGFAGSPLIWRDLVILNAGGAGTALDRDSGRIVWSNGTNATGYASPTLFHAGNTESVLIFAAQHLVALDPATGAERWRFPWKTDWDTNNSDPTVYDDCIFLSSFSRGCTLLSLKTGAPGPLYDSKVVCNNLSPGVLLGSCYYVFSGEAKKDTQLRCVDLPAGRLRWTAKEPTFGSLISAAGDLVVLAETGELFVFAKSVAGAESGPAQGPISNAAPAARAKVLDRVCWTQPSLANGRLYVRNARSEVRCLDVSVP